MVAFTIAWPVRFRALWAAARQLVTGRHVYLSTGCLANVHRHCKSMVGVEGQKRPARSKFTDAACVCPCHRRLR